MFTILPHGQTVAINRSRSRSCQNLTKKPNWYQRLRSQHVKIEGLAQPPQRPQSFSQIFMAQIFKESSSSWVTFFRVHEDTYLHPCKPQKKIKTRLNCPITAVPSWPLQSMPKGRWVNRISFLAGRFGWSVDPLMTQGTKFKQISTVIQLSNNTQTWQILNSKSPASDIIRVIRRYTYFTTGKPTSLGLLVSVRTFEGHHHPQPVVIYGESKGLTWNLAGCRSHMSHVASPNSFHIPKLNQLHYLSSEIESYKSQQLGQYSNHNSTSVMKVKWESPLEKEPVEL